MKPTPFSIARAGARSTPSVSAALLRFAGSVGWLVNAQCGSLVGDAQRQDLRVGETLLQFRYGAWHRPCLFQPDDDGRAGAGKRDARLAGDGVVAQLGEERRVLEPERLVQAVVERSRKERRVAGRDRGAEERRLRRRGGGVVVGQRLGEAAAGFQRVHALMLGATTIGASGKSAAMRAVCGPAPFCQIRQTPPRIAAARLSA